jgi:REP element-mobilizing transposase RayT
LLDIRTLLPDEFAQASTHVPQRPLAICDLAPARQPSARQYPPPHKLSAGQAFVWMDRHLDTTCSGPLFLRQEAIASLVADSLFRGVELGHYQLGAFVLMANHVHVLLLPLISPSRLLKSLKGYTAREANRRLGGTGEPFWQRESYDHWVRDEAEWKRIAAYIENNPVKAGLVSRAEEYRWSSAHATWQTRTRADKSVGSARTSACATVENPRS